MTMRISSPTSRPSRTVNPTLEQLALAYGKNGTPEATRPDTRAGCAGGPEDRRDGADDRLSEGAGAQLRAHPRAHRCRAAHHRPDTRGHPAAARHGSRHSRGNKPRGRARNLDHADDHLRRRDRSTSLLVIVAGILITREIKRRMAAASRLEAEKESLEREVAARTAELSALSSHLQDVSEKEKAALARELHDELGGLLVAAKMDISVLRKKLRTEDRRKQPPVGPRDGGTRRRRRPETPGRRAACTRPCWTTWAFTRPYAGNSRSPAGEQDSAAPRTCRTMSCRYRRRRQSRSSGSHRSR